MKQKINWENYFKRNKQKEKSPLDINILFPGYFKKNVFRILILVLIALAVFTMQSNDWELNFNYVECPEYVLTRCEYISSDANISNIYDFEEVQLNTIYLFPGEVLGNKPNDHYFKFENRTKLLILFAFLINHLLYFFRSRSWKIPINKSKWRKIKEALKNADKN